MRLLTPFRSIAFLSPMYFTPALSRELRGIHSWLVLPPQILMQSYFLSLHVIREPTFSIKQLRFFCGVVTTPL